MSNYTIKCPNTAFKLGQFAEASASPHLFTIINNFLTEKKIDPSNVLVTQDDVRIYISSTQYIALNTYRRFSIHDGDKILFSKSSYQEHFLSELHEGYKKLIEIKKAWSDIDLFNIERAIKLLGRNIEYHTPDINVVGGWMLHNGWQFRFDHQEDKIDIYYRHLLTQNGYYQHIGQVTPQGFVKFIETITSLKLNT